MSLENNLERTGNLSDFEQWMADNDRLVLAGLSNNGPGPFTYDEETVDSVRKRFIEKFGRLLGTRYYQRLIATFPERHKKLFPEVFSKLE